MIRAAAISAGVRPDRLTTRLADLVTTASENPPGNEAEVAGAVRTMCEEIGLDVELHEAEPNRPSVVARWENGPGPRLCYCSHIDVVPAGDPTLWEHDPYGAEIVDGYMFGRGSSDAKGPVAASLEAVAALKEIGARFAGTLELALVADEEAMGFKGAAYLVDKELIAPDVAIVGEPTSLRVVRAQRGACWIRVMTRGRAGHGSAPERGVSAIRHMAEIVLRLEETLPDISHPLLGGPTISVGTIRGGEKVNVIPAGCLIEVDRRSLPQESEAEVIASIEAAIDRARERFPDIDATVELAFYAQPFEISPEAPIVTEVYEAVIDAVGATEVIGFRGASDARFLVEKGADVVLFGPGDIKLAHTARESIELEELHRGAVVYGTAFARLLGASL